MTTRLQKIQELEKQLAATREELAKDPTEDTETLVHTLEQAGDMMEQLIKVGVSKDKILAIPSVQDALAIFGIKPVTVRMGLRNVIKSYLADYAREVSEAEIVTAVKAKVKELNVQVTDDKGKKRDVTDTDIKTCLKTNSTGERAWWQKSGKGYMSNFAASQQ